MPVLSASRPEREVTLSQVEKIAAGDGGVKLRAEVLRWHPGATREDVEEAFQEACVKATRACRGQSVGEVYVWLRTTTHREVGHMRQRVRRELPVDIADFAERRAAAALDASPEQQVIADEDELEVERISRAVLDRLTDTQREVVALYSNGRRKPEIAKQLGLTPRVVKRALERVLATGREELVSIAGRGCPSGEKLVSRAAFGLATGAELQRAQLHLTACDACGQLYERLDIWREKVAALLPVPTVEGMHPGAAEQTTQGIGHGLSRTRDHVADGLAQAKQHLVGVATRVTDPTPLAGARPGNAAAAIAGCLAIGGGATYCVERAVDPIGVALSPIAASAPKQEDDKPRRTQATTPTVPPPAPPPVSPAPPAPPPTPAAPAPAAPVAPPPPPPPPPQPADEFEPVAPRATKLTRSAATPSPAASPTPSVPAPAPAGGPGEFDGP